MKFTTRRFAIVAAMLFASLAFAQEQAAPAAPKPQEITITVQQAPAASAKQTTAAVANEWAQMGTNMGSAVGSAAKAILHETKDATFGKDVSVVDGIDKFTKTDAGRFTMLVVAWKVMGRDAIDLLDRVKNVAIGVPFLIAWTLLFIWFYRKNFTAYAVLKSTTGPLWNRVKTYEKVNEDDNWGEGKATAAVVTGVIYAVATLAVAVNIIF